MVVITQDSHVIVLLVPMNVERYVGNIISKMTIYRLVLYESGSVGGTADVC